MFKILFVLMFVSTNAFASQDMGEEAIRAMAGCYKVNFDYIETEKADPNYPISSKPYHEYGTEWITVDYDSQGEIHLQHVLVTPFGPQKHWRQEWVLAPKKAMLFKGDNHWVTTDLEVIAPEMWVQKVFQVDDSPRYNCLATWQYPSENSTEEAFSQCKTWGPLPRREFSQRSDYNVLNRGNKHVIKPWGWVHEEKNDKLSVKNDIATLIAKEEGGNTYTRIESSKCEPAKNYWQENKQIWHNIQSVWKMVYDHHPDLKLKAKVDNKTLWMFLFELAEKYEKQTYDPKQLQKEVHDTIHLFIE